MFEIGDFVILVDTRGLWLPGFDPLEDGTYPAVVVLAKRISIRGAPLIEVGHPLTLEPIFRIGTEDEDQEQYFWFRTARFRLHTAAKEITHDSADERTS